MIEPEVVALFAIDQSKYLTLVAENFRAFRQIDTFVAYHLHVNGYNLLA